MEGQCLKGFAAAVRSFKGLVLTFGKNNLVRHNHFLNILFFIEDELVKSVIKKLTR